MGRLFFFSIFLLLQSSCSRSEFLSKRYIDFNFTEEGFLNRKILQTIARTKYSPSGRGLRYDRLQCLQLAHEQAKRRALRVILHIYFRLPPGRRRDLRPNFKKDYPIKFANIDLVRGELGFVSILDRGVTVLQDNREKGKCMLVYRISGSDIPKEIRKMKQSFTLQKKYGR